VPGCTRATHAGSEDDETRRRILYFADAAGRNLDDRCAAAAAKRNLNLADGLAFFPNGGGERFLRLPFCALTPEQIEEGVRRLAECVKK
jgi:DNA-binding transcriptional MocR family regulator